jgi:hypothetical protein
MEKCMNNEYLNREMRATRLGVLGLQSAVNRLDTFRKLMDSLDHDEMEKFLKKVKKDMCADLRVLRSLYREMEREELGVEVSE